MVRCCSLSELPKEQTEAIDDEPEADHRNAGADPGQECALVGQVLRAALVRRDRGGFRLELDRHVCPGVQVPFPGIAGGATCYDFAMSFLHALPAAFLLSGALMALPGTPDGHPAKGGLPFIEDDYPRALAAAKARHVPIFVEAWAPW